MKIVKLEFRMRLFFLFTLLVLASACNINRPCDEPTKFPVQTGFYDYNNDILSDTIVENLSLYGIGKEDSLIYQGIDTNKVNFKLDPFSDSTKIVIMGFSKTDTLTFIYNRHLELVSPECSFAMFFDIHTILRTTNFIDSLSLLDNTLDANTQEHLQIFVR